LTVAFGTVINKDDPSVVKKSGPVKANTLLKVGLVYQDDSNGWTNAPTDGSIPAKRLYFNPIELNNLTGQPQKHGTFYGLNAEVVGESDGVIAVGDDVRASTTTAHEGIFQALAVPSMSTTPSSAEINNFRSYVLHRVAGYLGHVGEYKSIDKKPTNTADEDKNCVFKIIGGYA
jgi:hypothetical protein